MDSFSNNEKHMRFIEELTKFIKEQGIEKPEHVNGADYSRFHGRSLTEVKEYVEFYNEMYGDYEASYYDDERNIRPWTANEIKKTMLLYRGVPEEFKAAKEKILNFHKHLCELNDGYDSIFRYYYMKPHLKLEYTEYDPNLKKKIAFKHSYDDYEWGWSLSRVKEQLLWWNEELNPLYWTKRAKDKTKRYSKECRKKLTDWVNSQEEKDYAAFEKKLIEFKTPSDLLVDKQIEDEKYEAQREYWNSDRRRPEFKIKPSGRDYGLLFE